MIKNEDFKVSVCMITYNHEDFISQAIEGVMMQITDFQVELIIGEDCSTDRTREICLEYKRKYPTKINLRLPDKNLGSMSNFSENLNVCTIGYKYVAMCEGDDYWIDPYKLQKQINYLENKSDCGLVYTDVKHFDNSKQIFLHNSPKFVTDETRVVPELIKSKYIDFPSIVVRANLLEKVLKTLNPEWQDKIIGDTRLILEFSQHSKIGYIPEETTVYRILEGSASHPVSIEKYLFASNDTFQARLNFVNRYHLNNKLLGDSMCNFNRGIIHKAFAQANYINMWRVIRNLKIRNTFLYCDKATLLRKYNIQILLKFFAAILGIGVLKKMA